MKRLIALILLVSGFTVGAQNLVPNPSFETIVSCPTGNSGISNNLCLPWRRPPGSITTPDLFHTCASAGTACSNVNVPSNYGGIANAADGNAYAGVIGIYNSCPNCREYVQAQLTSPLVAGESYDIGYLTRCSPYSYYGIDHMGIHISTTAPSQPSSNQPMGWTPTYEHPGQILDKNNWTLVQSTYVATGGEEGVTIGCFLNNASLNVYTFGPSGGGCILATAGGFYYIDSVFVTQATTLVSAELNLRGSYRDGGHLLRWESEWEKQNYIVEHASEGMTFEALGQSSVREFFNPAPAQGNHYYRIRARDLDGHTVYSNVLVLKGGGDIPFTLEVWPNPASDRLNMRVYKLEAEQAPLTIELTDAVGRLIRRETWTEDAPSVEGEWSLNHVEAGMYMLRVQMQGRSITRKVIIR